MKTLIYLISVLFVSACNTNPQIVTDPTIDHSIVGKKLNHDIVNNEMSCGWGWIIWYVPIAILVFGWVWKEWIYPTIRHRDVSVTQTKKEETDQGASTSQTTKKDI